MFVRRLRGNVSNHSGKHSSGFLAAVLKPCINQARKRNLCINPNPYSIMYSGSGKVGRWFTEIGAWCNTPSNFKFGRVSRTRRVKVFLRFPPSTGVSRTHRESSFPQVLAEIRPTQKRWIRGCRGAGLPFPGCGVAGCCQARNAVPAKQNKGERSHQKPFSFWRPCGVPDCPERKVGRVGFRSKRAATHFPTFRLPP